jgi:hypothetical protein
MTTIPPFSPGCFGSALAFKEDDVACRSCKFAGECKPMHLSAQKALRERYGIQTTQEVIADEKAKRSEEKAARAAAIDPAALTLPKKVQELILRLDRGNYDIVRKLQNGENPFGASMKFMALVAHLLLRLPQVDKGLITTAFWQENTAEAHARMAIQALEHVGAIDNRDGLVSIRRAA